MRKMRILNKLENRVINEIISNVNIEDIQIIDGFSREGYSSKN